eukprot:m.352079 g.352079  ORF g.352079 m.352079 type:complete len:319 (+) comp19899_c0_seq8:557-1513(+)
MPLGHGLRLPLVISSRQNEIVKLVRGLRRWQRLRKQKLVRLDGRRLVDQGLELGWAPTTVLATPDEAAWLRQRLEERQSHSAALPAVLPLSSHGSQGARADNTGSTLQQRWLRSLHSATEQLVRGAMVTPRLEPVVAVGPRPLQRLCQDITPDERIVVVAVQDPGNLGSIVRSCVAFGVDRMCVLDTCVDPYHPSVLRSSAGLSLAMPYCDLAAVTRAVSTGVLPAVSASAHHGLTPAEACQRMHERTVPATNSTGDGTPSGFVLFVGHETRGVAPDLVDSFDPLPVTIPVRLVDSLGVAAATAVVLQCLRAGLDAMT